MVVEDSVLLASKAVRKASLDGEIVLLDLRSGKYFGFNEVSARIWELVEEQKTIREISSALCAEFEVSPDKSLKDVRRTVQRLLSFGLVTVDSAAQSAGATI